MVAADLVGVLGVEPPLEQWRRRGQQVTLLGHDLFVVKDGQPQRPALLLIHGFPTAGWDWHRMLPHLRPHFNLLVPDMLGYGFSSKPSPHRYTIAEQADLLEALLKRNDIEQFHILAHDYGDTVAQELLARDNARGANARCLSVALLNGGLFPEATRPRLVQKLMLGALGPLVVRLVQHGTLKRNMHAIFGPETPPSEEDIDTFWALIQHNRGRRVFHQLIQYIRERDTHRDRWLRALRETRAPRRLINGSEDPISGEHLAVRYGELIDAAEVIALPGIGHYPQMEAADEVARHYLDFVKLSNSNTNS